jgi:hypothetical protein
MEKRNSERSKYENYKCRCSKTFLTAKEDITTEIIKKSFDKSCFYQNLPNLHGATVLYNNNIIII